MTNEYTDEYINEYSRGEFMNEMKRFHWRKGGGTQGIRFPCGPLPQVFPDVVRLTGLHLTGLL